MQRRILKEQIKCLQEGGDPIGVIFDEDQSLVRIRSGNFFSMNN